MKIWPVSILNTKASSKSSKLYLKEDYLIKARFLPDKYEQLHSRVVDFSRFNCTKVILHRLIRFGNFTITKHVTRVVLENEELWTFNAILFFNTK